MTQMTVPGLYYTAYVLVRDHQRWERPIFRVPMKLLLKLSDSGVAQSVEWALREHYRAKRKDVSHVEAVCQVKKLGALPPGAYELRVDFTGV